MAYQRKTRDIYEIQTDYGYGDGFEYTTAETDRKSAYRILDDCRKNQPQYRHRMVKKREKINPPGQESETVV